MSAPPGGRRSLPRNVPYDRSNRAAAVIQPSPARICVVGEDCQIRGLNRIGLFFGINPLIQFYWLVTWPARRRGGRPTTFAMKIPVS